MGVLIWILFALLFMAALCVVTAVLEAIPESLPLPRFGNARRVFIHRCGIFLTLMFSNTKHFLYQDYDWRVKRAERRV